MWEGLVHCPRGAPTLLLAHQAQLKVLSPGASLVLLVQAQGILCSLVSSCQGSQSQAGHVPAAQPASPKAVGWYLWDYGEPASTKLIQVHILLPDPQAVRVLGFLWPVCLMFSHDIQSEQEAENRKASF